MELIQNLLLVVLVNHWCAVFFFFFFFFFFPSLQYFFPHHSSNSSCLTDCDSNCHEQDGYSGALFRIDKDLPKTTFFNFFSIWQVRKLEFLLADALQKGCDHIVTCGGIQSNHSRVTAVAARQLGLQPHLLLRQHGDIVSEGKNFGNLNLKNN